MSFARHYCTAPVLFERETCTLTPAALPSARSMCFNRLHPTIPMAAWANPGEVVLFDTPTSTADIKDKALLEENLAFSPSVEYIGTLHQLAGPLGVYGAMAGDKIAIVSRHPLRCITGIPPPGLPPARTPAKPSAPDPRPSTSLSSAPPVPRCADDSGH